MTILKCLLSALVIIFISPELLGQVATPPANVRLELIEAQNRLILNEASDDEDLVLVKGSGMVGAAQKFGQLFSFQSLNLSSGKSLNEDRKFSDIGGSIGILNPYPRGQFGLQLFGNWSKGRDFSNSLTLQDLVDIEDPNEVTSRYIRLGVSFSHTLSARSDFSAQVAQERLDSFDQNLITDSVFLNYVYVITSSSNIRYSFQGNQQKNSEGAVGKFMNLSIFYDYRYDTRNIFSFQTGIGEADQNESKNQIAILGFRFLHMMFRNRYLQANSNPSPNAAPISQSSNKILQQVQTQSFQDSISLAITRNFDSNDDGRTLALTDSVVGVFNSEVTASVNFQANASYSEQKLQSDQDTISENHNFGISLIKNYFSDTEQETPSMQVSGSASHSRAINLQNGTDFKRRIISLSIQKNF